MDLRCKRCGSKELGVSYKTVQARVKALAEDELPEVTVIRDECDGMPFGRG